MVLLVYDSGNRKSFEGLEDWLKMARDNVSDEALFMVLANACPRGGDGVCGYSATLKSIRIVWGRLRLDRWQG